MDLAMLSTSCNQRRFLPAEVYHRLADLGFYS